MTVTPHPELPGYYETQGWSFSIDPAEDGSLEETERAILAWNEWRDFLLSREHAEQNAELDLET